MFLTNASSIRDVILFPTMKPIVKKDDEEEEPEVQKKEMNVTNIS